MAANNKSVRERVEDSLKSGLDTQCATLSDNRLATQRQRHQAPCSYRTEFQRDYTRILHSKAFRRLRHKTQVFVSPRNDHICTRLEHSLYVASVARTVANALRLNTELTDAIALGHDLGHAPCGHWGGEYLAQAYSRIRGLRRQWKFSHEVQSLRVVDELESPYLVRQGPGLNLTFAVRDGIVSHCGEEDDAVLVPNRSKTPDDLSRQYLNRKVMPATMEGCVVRLADRVAYLGRDLEDAIITGTIARKDIPKAVSSVLGRNNRAIISTLIKDIVTNSSGQEHIAVSKKVHRALAVFMDFSLTQIYGSQKVKRFFGIIQSAMAEVFGKVHECVQSLQEEDRAPTSARRPGTELGCDNPLYHEAVVFDFLVRDVGASWRQKNSASLARDFVAGMTDSYFIEYFKCHFLPRSTV